ncbi:EamA family transporter [Streptomyces indicus]|uniref:Probable blue pigment (Indigoidine) exporter n=1 Tax=Streptomyces indicus TaxID=417292 RepID=A0A1G9B5A4_9ACTN|nr:EamA family transporter [Streptomyces indicus]SDK34284.1 probable blue pigment (indigoidine) exporter [Streptomyces indicus]
MTTVMSPSPVEPAASAARTAAAAGTFALILATALAPMAWGTTYAVTTEFLPADHPLFAALLRSLPGGLLLVLLTRVLPSGAWWWKAAVLGVLNIGAFYPLLFLTAELLPGGVAATLGAVQPLIVAGLAVGVMRERPSFWRIGWAVAGAAGVGMVVLGPAAGLGLAGVAAGLLGTASMALGVVLTKHWRAPEGVGPMAMTGWQLTAGGLFLLPLTLLFEGAPPQIDGSAVLGYLWLGTVGGFIAHTLWLRGIGRLPVTATALLILLSPLVAAVIGAFVLDESFTAVQLVGLVLALGALVAGQLSPGRRTAREPGPGRRPARQS